MNLLVPVSLPRSIQYSSTDGSEDEDMMYLTGFVADALHVIAEVVGSSVVSDTVMSEHRGHHLSSARTRSVLQEDSSRPPRGQIASWYRT